MKIRHYTHTDLDGVGSYVVMRTLFPESEGHIVDVTFCDYDKVDKKVQNFLKSKYADEYDYMFITDISVNEETAVLLEEANLSLKGPFVELLDHHGTAEWLNQYDWAHVEQKVHGDEEHKSSGTSLIIDFFERQRPGFERNITPSIRQFAETVRRYDTWEWSTFYNETLPKELNDYLYMIGREPFATQMIERINENNEELLFFDEAAQALLNQKQKEIKGYIEKKEKQMYKVQMDEGIVGIVFADQYTSELGNELCKNNEDIAFVIMIDMGEKKLSFRTVKNDIDLGKFAKERYDGGGHPKAAGAQFNEDQIAEFLSELL